MNPLPAKLVNRTWKIIAKVGTWEECTDAIKVNVISSALNLAGDLALDYFSVAICLFKGIDSLLVLSLFL